MAKNGKQRIKLQAILSTCMNKKCKINGCHVYFARILLNISSFDWKKGGSLFEISYLIAKITRRIFSHLSTLTEFFRSSSKFLFLFCIEKERANTPDYYTRGVEFTSLSTVPPFFTHETCPVCYRSVAASCYSYLPQLAACKLNHS